MSVGTRQSYKGKKPLLGALCEICRYKNHQTIDCYRLIGYPPNFKRKPTQTYKI